MKNCVVCGGAAEVRSDKKNEDEYHYVACTECDNETGVYTTTEEAVSAWEASQTN